MTDDELDDGPVLAVHDDDGARVELASVRAAWNWEDQYEVNFYTRVLGGAWAMRTVGVAAYCVSGFARAWVQDRCRAVALPTSAQFGFGRYGRADARQLCREWCRRSGYFLPAVVGGRYSARIRVQSGCMSTSTLRMQSGSIS